MKKSKQALPEMSDGVATRPGNVVTHASAQATRFDMACVCAGAGARNNSSTEVE